MNSTNKKAVPQSKSRVPAESAKQPVAVLAHKPRKTVLQAKSMTGPVKSMVLQAKTKASAQSVKQPIAPPVFRPKTKAVTVQAKMMAPASPVKNHPVAPPVYRPQPPAKVLQTKRAAGQQPGRKFQEQTRFGAQSRPTVIQRAKASAKELLEEQFAAAEEQELAYEDFQEELEKEAVGQSKRSAPKGQEFRKSCGLAAVVMLVKSLIDYQPSELDMAEFLGKNPSFQGTTEQDLLSLIKYCHVLGATYYFEGNVSVATRKLLARKIVNGPIICGLKDVRHWIVIDRVKVTPGKVTNEKLGLYAPDEYTFIGRDPWGMHEAFPPKGEPFEFNVEQLRAQGACKYIYIDR
jgi:hypothetical protein